MALAGIEVDGVFGSHAPGAAGEAFDANLLLHHVRSSALGRSERITRTRDAAKSARRALTHAGGGQSVEYLGWTFSPLIAAITLLAAIAASPMPIVISVILPG